MNIVEALNYMEEVSPISDPYAQSPYEPTLVNYQLLPPTSSYAEEFKTVTTRPTLYNMDGSISPYSSDNWGGANKYLQQIDDVSRLPPFSDKLDPNRIFNADIQALNTAQSDQGRITRAFEKKLMSSLQNRDNAELSELDILAMQAVTASRNAITTMRDKQINIKKNIADIKIKQKAAGSTTVGDGGSSAGGRVGGMDAYSISMAMMDNIHNMDLGGGAPADFAAETYDPNESTGVSMSNQFLEYEHLNPTINVVLGETDDDVDFVAYDSSGNAIHGYPIGDIALDSIDRVGRKAIDKEMQEYPIRLKHE